MIFLVCSGRLLHLSGVLCVSWRKLYLENPLKSLTLRYRRCSFYVLFAVPLLPVGSLLSGAIELCQVGDNPMVEIILSNHGYAKNMSSLQW